MESIVGGAGEGEEGHGRALRRLAHSELHGVQDPALGGRLVEDALDLGVGHLTRLDDLGERTIWIDCDVIQADGGTRTASITGGFVAMTLALEKLRKEGIIARVPVEDYVAAISVGIVGGLPLTDLAYEEDSKADVDMNVVKTGDGRFIEIQGTAEGAPFDSNALSELLNLANTAIKDLVEMQRDIVGSVLK